MIPVLYKDFYKTDHIRQYPHNTTKVYSNLTARISRVPGIDKIVVFGIHYFVKKYLVDAFDEFFEMPKIKAIRWYKRRMDTALGKDAAPVYHIEHLHKVGYLPIVVKALPEGTLCPLRVPFLTITNTHPDFAWLPNDLETLLSCELWHPITTATIAFQYRKVLEEYAAQTSDIPEFVKWQGHDFSMRGQTSLDSAAKSGAAHLLSFTGTDTIPAIDFLEKYYRTNSELEVIGGSVPATEHSVMCLGGQSTEYETFKRLITKVYPKGVVSIVSDTWDFWDTLTNIIPKLKETILARDGKVVIRPDSGDPELILMGDPNGSHENEKKGALQILWDIFGGVINSKGYKQLDPHIGLIYGDSITLDRCKSICARMKAQGFASTNVVFGIGSYTYQYVTRDTFGMAMKATYGIVGSASYELCKDPVTDKGLKKSAKGMLAVHEIDGELVLKECCTFKEECEGLLEVVYLGGFYKMGPTLEEMRKRLESYLVKTGCITELDTVNRTVTVLDKGIQ